MIIIMKTTINISDAILLKAKELASQQHITLTQLFEEGLAKVVEERSRHSAYDVHPILFDGNGLQPEFETASWSKIRDVAYEGHGT